MAVEARTILSDPSAVDVADVAEAHKPYVSPSAMIPEFTPRAVILGALFGIIFGASTVYLGVEDRVDRERVDSHRGAFDHAAARLGPLDDPRKQHRPNHRLGGRIDCRRHRLHHSCTLDLGLDLDVLRTALIALTGGLLGTLLMIPLRRSLIVKEHGNLPYPEGTACAEVLVAGEKGGSDAKTVFLGFGVGLIYKFLMLGLKFWRDVPSKILAWYQNARIAAEISPELLGVGYIIGPRTASFMLGGGVIAALILVRS